MSLLFLLFSLSLDSPPCSPISRGGGVARSLQASSSPLLRHAPFTLRSPTSSGSRKPPIPFLVATPPSHQRQQQQQLRTPEGPSPFLVGRRGADSASKEKFPSPDISPIKDAGKFLVNRFLDAASLQKSVSFRPSVAPPCIFRYCHLGFVDCVPRLFSIRLFISKRPFYYDSLNI